MLFFPMFCFIVKRVPRKYVAFFERMCVCAHASAAPSPKEKKDRVFFRAWR